MAYMVWRRGRYAELVRGVREGERVRQVRLAYLDARPRLTPALKARGKAQCPGGVDRAKIEAAILTRGEPVAGGRGDPPAVSEIVDRRNPGFTLRRHAHAVQQEDGKEAPRRLAA